MTNVEAIKRMKKARLRDHEDAHSDADEILCELLISLGFKELIEIYNEIDKWYS